MVGKKICAKCGNDKPLTEDNWYKARPTTSHPKDGWQSHCKDCWKVVNRQNKERRKKVVTFLEMQDDNRAG